MSLAVVTGLAAEARIAQAPDIVMLIGAGRADRLAADLEIAIAEGARRLLSFGVAGAVAPRLRPGDLIVAQSVRDGGRSLGCDPAWRTAIVECLTGPSLQAKPGDRVASASTSNSATGPISGLLRFARNDGWAPIADPGCQGVVADIVGVDAPLAAPLAKAALFAATGAAAIDMESAIVARAAVRRGLPFAILRVIADPAHRPLPPAALVAMRADGGVDVAAVLSALLRNQAQLPALIRLGLDSREAFSALVRVRALLGADFASVDLGDL